MNSRHHPELDKISADLAEAVPALRGLSLEQIAIPLGGLSNSNYRLDLPDGSLVLRVPRPNPGLFRIDCQEEVKAARFAGTVGIGPCRFRFHSARDSEMKSATIPINLRPPFRDKSGHHSDHCPARG
jgi:Ser/Thr protein kinase RdoA (MazF antagonist)